MTECKGKSEDQMSDKFNIVTEIQMNIRNDFDNEQRYLTGKTPVHFLD